MTNYKQLEIAISKAISLCTSDKLEDVKSSLYRALHSVQRTMKKKARHDYMNKMNDNVRKLNQEHWQKVIENAKKFAALEGELPVENDKQINT